MGLVGSLVTCKKAGFMEGVVRKIQFKPQIGTVALLKLMVTFIFLPTDDRCSAQDPNFG